MSRLHLSPPLLGDAERDLLTDALDSNWVAPLGPHVDAFEAELAVACGVRACAALSSGTAALELALRIVGVTAGDEVVVPSLTFVATANAVTYIGARPCFVDSEPRTWNLDADLLAELLADRARAGRLPAAVCTVDLYGQCADHPAILEVTERYGIPVVEDAAEALGATWQGRPAGSFGRCGVLSFNGNKIITTSGGGALVTDDPAIAARARHLATQAREPVAHYEHTELGWNFRLSNLLAAVGRGQLRTLRDRVEHRRANKAAYRAALGDLPGVGFMPDDPRGEPTNWLTVMTLDPDAGAPTPDAVRAALDAADIEARPAWKPMHRQPLYRDAPMVGGAVADGIFEHGLCLPSGSDLSAADRERVVEAVAGAGFA